MENPSPESNRAGRTAATFVRISTDRTEEEQIKERAKEAAALAAQKAKEGIFGWLSPEKKAADTKASTAAASSAPSS